MTWYELCDTLAGVKSRGGRVVLADFTAGQSTSRLIAANQCATIGVEANDS
jgi:bifunctional ADP-heptose synthase (sugar kinase/adenylyltransferase)